MENNNDNYYLDVVDWEIPDLFNPEFHKYLDSIIDETSEYLIETHQISPELTRKENEKMTEENYSFLWKLTNNKFKYYCFFHYNFFKQFMSLVSDDDYELLRRLILSFQTEMLIKILINHIVYHKMVHSIS